MSCSFSFRTFVAFTAVCLLMESPVASAIVIARADTSDTPSVLGTLRGPDGQQHDLAAPANGLSVLVFYSSECPISNAYSPTLGVLAAAFPAERVKWVGVCIDPDLSDADVRAHARDFNLKFPVVRDRQGTLARRMGATMTPEAFVVDANGHVRYHGRIDDQFAKRGVRKANPSGNELSDAVTALLKGDGGEGGLRSSRWLPYTQVQRRCGRAHLQQGRGSHSPAELPGMSSQGPGGAVRPGHLRAGSQTGR